jgi:hypothetical protein
MEAISETTIAPLNIKRYRRLIEQETDAVRREKLSRLVAEEEAKLNTLRSGLSEPC